jgi:NADH:ubiquinone oxidoreductase subunit 2 (subunit N)
MFMRDEEQEAPLATSTGVRLAVTVAGVLTLAIGIYPEPFLQFAGAALVR